MLRAQFVHGDLVVLAVADQPLVGVQAVVPGSQTLDYFVDVAAILYRRAGTKRHGSTLGIEWRLANGGLGEDHSGVVLVPVGAALDPAWIALHHHPVAC